MLDIQSPSQQVLRTDLASDLLIILEKFLEF